jgi:hypothetical protein
MAQNDPYVKYGGRAAQATQQATPASDPYARYGGRVATAPANAQATAPEPQGFFSSFGDASGISTLAHAAANPLNTAATVLDAAKRVVTPGQPQKMTDNPNPIISGVGRMVNDSVSHFKQGVQGYRQNGLTPDTRRQFGQAIPIVGPAFEKAQEQHDSGNDAGAAGTVLGLATGFVGPEMLKAAPAAISSTVGKAGEVLQDSGANRMDRFLNGGKPLPVGEYNAPGAAVLDAGPSTSIVLKRPSLAPKIAAAKNAAAPSIDAAAAATSGRVSIPNIRNAVDSTIAPLKALATGPGGNPGVAPRLDYLRDSFGPQLNLNGSVSAPGALDLRRTLDSNINWNRGPDPIDATARNATRQIRGKVNSLLYDAAPEVREPSQRYGNLADAQQLAEDNANAKDVRYGSFPRTMTDLAVGATTSAATHNPLYGAGAAVATHGLPMLWKAPLTQTGVATGAYQLGRGLSLAAPVLKRIAGPMAGAVQSLPALGSRLALPALAAPSLSPQLPLATPLQQPSTEGQYRNDYGGSPNQQSQQSAPPNGAYRRTNVTPQIIRPQSDMPRPPAKFQGLRRER